MGTKRSNPFEPDECPTASKRECIEENQALCHCCGNPITNEYVYKLRNRVEIHPQCMKCCQCQRPLTENDTCLMRNGKIFCKQDYVRSFSVNCNRCKRPFSESDYVIRASYNLYHLACFQCDICQKSISSGSEYAPLNGKLYCLKDFEVVYNRILTEVQSMVKPESSRRTKVKITNESNHDADDNEKSDTEDFTDDECDEDGESPSGEAKSAGRKEKATRIRTVLNENQLYTLRTCYNANPRPDALMKEQLVEMTGLSPRVIRVWFQNKRCKDKKKAIMMKQIEEHEQLRALSESAIPLIASGPIHSNDIRQLPSVLNPVFHHEQHPVNFAQVHNPWFIQNTIAPNQILARGDFNSIYSTRLPPIHSSLNHVQPCFYTRGPPRQPQFVIRHDNMIHSSGFRPVNNQFARDDNIDLVAIRQLPQARTGPTNNNRNDQLEEETEGDEECGNTPRSARQRASKKRRRKRGNNTFDDDLFDPFTGLPPM